jgi:hypothetical protein
MQSAADGTSWSFQRLLIFWWILLLLIQQAERLFLLPNALSQQIPPAGMLGRVLTTGLRADLITATYGIMVAAVLGGALGILIAGLLRWRGIMPRANVYRRGLTIASILVAFLLLTLLIVDTAYYIHSQHRLDFAFFEYLGDVSMQGGGRAEAAQAAQQTRAELRGGERWVLSLGGLMVFEAVIIAAWWLGYGRILGPRLAGWASSRPLTMTLVLVLALVGGATGFHPRGASAIRVVDIDNGLYYTLAQNPLLDAREAARMAFDSQLIGPAQALKAMPLEEAVRVAQEVLGHGGTFPDLQYPLVKEIAVGPGIRFDRPANVLLLFIEGLDRRFLGRTFVMGGDPAPEMPSPTPFRGGNPADLPMPAAGQGIRVTPFLDRLTEESVFFENFFTNSIQTSRGLFASLCSYYSRHGTIDMKTRGARDYLCLPALLRRGGYQTEMVIGQQGDINGLHAFLMRNGLHRLFDESDFPRGAERMGLGITDGALFDFLRSRIESLQNSGVPFFLTALTLSTHHPFMVPQAHPEVRALQAMPDGYVAALRYTDLVLQRFFTGLQRDGLLKNTVVFILGDHGRHEPVGRTEAEHQIGRFTAPLFVWMDESLRTPTTYHPRVVSMVASQVDLTPTILALNGLTPRLAPFLGQDLSCVLAADCLQDNLAFMTNVDDNLIVLADRAGLSFYSLRTEAFHQTDLKLAGPALRRRVTDPDIAPQYRRLLALYVSSNMLLEQNRIWSWQELGGTLYRPAADPLSAFALGRKGQ